jgi:predicted dinucleotide-binding enzyme
MKIAVLGTGIVGRTIGSKLVVLGHDVMMGSRTSDNETATTWAKDNNARAATFADAARDAEVIFNCVNGVNTLEAFATIATEDLDGKIVIDVANELDVADGKPMSLASATNSLGQKLQDAYPEAKVVKSLNTMSCFVMVEPARVPGHHNVFMSGNDAGARTVVRDLLSSFGWKDSSIIDLGDIESAVGPEMYMSFWLSIFLSGNGADDAMFNTMICN